MQNHISNTMERTLQTIETKDWAAEQRKPYSTRVLFGCPVKEEVSAIRERLAFLAAFSVDQITKIIDKNKFPSNYKRRENRCREVRKRSSWTIPGLVVFRRKYVNVQTRGLNYATITINDWRRRTPDVR